MGAVWYRFRAELRTRWRAWLGLALLIGAAAGGITAAAAGARRTATASDRFLVSQRAFDLFAGCPPPEEIPPGEACDPDEVARLPEVVDAASIVSFGPGSAEVRTGDGRAVQPDPDDFEYTGPGEISLIASPDNSFGTEVNRLKILSGRAPDPERPEEVAIPVDLADRLGLHPGDELRATFLAPSEDEEGEEPPTALPPVTFEIVGVEAAPFEIAPTSGPYESIIHLTPAFLEHVPVGVPVPQPEIALYLRDGVDVDRFVADLEQRGVFVGPKQADQAQLVEDTIRPQAVALWLVATLAALAALAVLGQLLVRQTFLESSEHPTLRSVGMGRRQLWALGMTRTAAIAALAGVIAAVIAVSLSPLTPIGLARTVEPDPGVSLDATALAIGGAITLVAALAVVALPAGRLARVGGTELDPAMAVARRPTWVADVARRVALPPTPVTGMRMALEPGRGRSAVPVRVTLVGVTVGIVTMAAALSFSGSLDHLLETPRLSGWNWDLAVQYPGVFGADGEFTPVDEDTLSDALARDDDIVAFSFGDYFRPFPTQDYALELDGTSQVDVITFGGGSVGPTVIDGRAPSAANELLVGVDVLDELGLDVGDRLTAVGRVGEFEDPEALREVSTRMRIVGTGVVPTPGGELGRGAVITLDGLQAFDPEFDFQTGAMWLRLAPGADALEVLGRVGESLGLPGGEGDEDLDDVAIGWDPSSELLDLKQVDDLPLLLAGLMALLATGTLAHVLATAVRARRRELAVLKTLGFVRGQVRGAVACQATITAVLALAIGFPIGIAIGRWVWRLFAEQLGVLPEPSLPSLPLLIAYVVGILVVANVVAAVPAWVAARTRPAFALRVE